MSFAHPATGFLVFLFAVAVFFAWYRAQQKRQKAAVQFSDPELLAIVAPRRPGLIRHLGALTIFISLIILSLAAAKPQVLKQVSERQSRVILVLDASYSMVAKDVQPSRIGAMKKAAKEFVDVAPANTEIAVVEFSDVAEPLNVPTTDRTRLKTVIDSIDPLGATATGEGIYSALGMLETEGFVKGRTDLQKRRGSLLLLSDGAANAGRDPIRAAEYAARIGVPISTVAFGTDEGVVQDQPVKVDTQTLRQIASTTGGKAFTATDADQLKDVFKTAAKSIKVSRRYVSVADAFAFFAALILTVGALLSLRRSPRLP